MLNNDVNSPIVDAALGFWQKAKKPQWHRVEGISMWPVLQSGDRALVVPEIDHLTVGDIVLVRFNQRLLVHRIEQLLPSGYLVTWGDFNMTPDPVVKISQVVGRVSNLERNGRELSLGGWRRWWGRLTSGARPVAKPVIRLLRIALRIRSAVYTMEQKAYD